MGVRGELEAACFCAPATTLADERATSAVAFPHFASDVGGNRPASPFRPGCGCAAPLRKRRLLLERLLEEETQRALDDGGGVAVRDLMREQIAFDESFDKDWGAGS